MARTPKSEQITLTCTRTGFTFTGTPDECAEHFYRDKSTKSGFSPWCKDAEREYNKAYREGLKEAGSNRKADADAQGVKKFDATMQKMGVRTSRGKKATTPAEAPKKRAPRRRTARKA
jgi:hypothetical protein